MKKIDWDNLNYYDFIGGIGIGVILLFGIYLGGGFGIRQKTIDWKPHDNWNVYTMRFPIRKL